MPIPIDVPFLAAVALAGVAYVAGEQITARSALLRSYHAPEPLVGGLLAALVLFVLHLASVRVEVPTSGSEVDFLMGLLTTNMGLHVSREVFRKGYRLFGLFLAGALALFFLQLALVLPVALTYPDALPAALLLGPVSFLGAPYNLNPPAQVPPIAALLAPAAEAPEATAQGLMMLGILAGSMLAALMGRRFLRQAGQHPPEASAEDSETPPVPLWTFSHDVTKLVILVLVLVVLAFGLQGVLLAAFPAALEDDHVPVIVLSYLLGITVRLGYERLPLPRFPEKALTVLLLGPTMSLVLTYAALSIPLHHLTRLSGAMVAAGLLAVAGSGLVAWMLLYLLRRITDDYYAVVISTAFVAVTTGWGPIAMSFLRRYTGWEGRVEPMPVILPLNAFFLFPWLVILLTRLVLRLAG